MFENNTSRWRKNKRTDLEVEEPSAHATLSSSSSVAKVLDFDSQTSTKSTPVSAATTSTEVSAAFKAVNDAATTVITTTVHDNTTVNTTATSIGISFPKTLSTTSSSPNTSVTSTNISHSPTTSNVGDTSAPVFGPTTRRQWNAYVKRPVSQSGTENDNDSSVSDTYLFIVTYFL